MAKKVRTDIRYRLNNCVNDMKRFKENIAFIIECYIPANTDIDIAINELTLLYKTIEERPDISIIQLYATLLSNNEITDYGIYAKYVIRTFGLMLAAHELQLGVVEVINQT